MREDIIISGKDTPDIYGYGTNSKGEDFAVSIAEFIVNHDVFEKEFPNRRKILKRLLGF